MLTKAITAGASYIHSKRNWIVLLILTSGLFGVYAFYDAPGALAVWLEDDLNIQPTKLGILYSAYSAPSIVFALFCGYLLDQFGISVFLCIYQFLTVVACGMFAVAYSRPEGMAFVMMTVSRVIAGLSGDGLAIVSRRAVFSWFDEVSQSLAVTLVMSLPFLGTQYSFIALPWIASNLGGQAGFWSVFIMSCVCATTAIFYIIISRKWPSEWESVSDKSDEIELSWCAQFGRTLKSITWRFWILVLSDVCVQAALWPFVAFSPEFFYHHYHFSPEVSGIFATVLAGMAIPFGLILGYIGRRIPRPIIGMFSGFLQIICFLVLAWCTNIPPIIGTLGLAIVLGSVGTFAYAPVSQLIPKENLGMALGILKSCESISWLITPPLYGFIYEETGTPAWSCTMFACMGVGAIFFQAILFCFPVNQSKKNAPLIAHV